MMRKLLQLMFVIGIPILGMNSELQAQITELSNGNVGIGTSPTVKLDVAGEVKTNNGRFVLRDNSIEEWKTNGNSEIAINYYGYNRGNTQYRDFAIYNGKSSKVMFVDGSSGNVGIGTSNPLNRLHLFKLNDFNGGSLRFGHSGAYDAVLSFGYNSLTARDAIKLSYFPHNSTTSKKDLITFDTNGNVGIGTTTPKESLTVSKAGACIGIYDTNPASQSNNRIARYGNSLVIQNDLTGTWNDNIIFRDNGSVGIGATATGTHKLAVEGTIGAREIKVEASGWSDFVFEDDYKLKDLEEVESFIEENKHLPDVPSEKEVLENGIQLGEMDAKLLQKIEELTLYMIEMNKRVKTLEEENKILKRENKILKIL